MNRILRISLLLVVGFAIGRFSHEGSANAQVADRPPPCQDVNGDGQSNVTDAVFLLTWLFGRGPGPECPRVGLPDTGQTTCYGVAGNVVDCASATCAGQDGLYATGCPPEGRFTDNGAGTVTDTCTGLMWQKDTGNDGNRLAWCDALAYCENLELADHDDWRLPNVRELQSIVDYGRFGPAIDPVFGALSSWYWSSTSHGGGGRDGGWSVNFSDGDHYSGVDVGRARAAPLFVRAVRTAP